MKHSNKTASRSLAALALAVGLAACGSGSDETDEATDGGTTGTADVARKRQHGRQGPDRSSSATANRSAASSELEYDAGDEIHFKVDSDVADEVHVHGYDLMKDVAGRRHRQLRLPGRNRRHLRGRARGPQGADRGAAGQPVTLLPFAHALVARQDLPIPAWLFAWGASIVLIVSFFALSAAWRKPRFEEAHWRPLGAGLSRALARPAGPGRSAACVGVFLLGVAIYAGLRGTEAPDRNFALTFLFVTAGSASPSSRRSSATSSGPSTPGARSAAPPAPASGRSPASAPPTSPTRERLGRWPAAIGLLAVVWLEVVYGSSGGVAVGLDPRRRRRRRPRLQRLHAGDDGPVRGRGVVRARRGLLGLLRDVLPARLLRRRGRPARPPPPALGGDQLGDAARLGRRRDRLDRHDQLRRRPGGRLQGRRSKASSTGSSTPASSLTTALRLTDTIFIAALLRRRRPRLPARRARDADRPRRALAGEAADRLRPHPDPDRARLPGRPLLQPLRLPGAGPVHLPALRPARHRAPPTSSAPPPAASTTRSSAPTRSGTSRSAPSSSATSSASPSPTTAPSPTGPTTATPPAPSTGCWR